MTTIRGRTSEERAAQREGYAKSCAQHGPRHRHPIAPDASSDAGAAATDYPTTSAMVRSVWEVWADGPSDWNHETRLEWFGFALLVTACLPLAIIMAEIARRSEEEL